MSESFLNGRVTLHSGNCLDVLATLEESSIDSCVTDPPYHLTSIVKRFGKPGSAPVKVDEFFDANENSKGASPYKRASAGFMGKQWDGGEIAFEPETWAAVMRVLKPGGHLLAFGAPKNFGFMQTAIAQAGFEVRDVLCWLFGSGFPKSHDVSKGIDRAADAIREVVGKAGGRRAYGDKPTAHAPGAQFRWGDKHFCWDDLPDNAKAYFSEAALAREFITAPATDAARAWEGWGTALKPAYEPIILARKPLSESTVAANVLRWGTGALNIDATRVGTDGGTKGCDAGPSNGILGDGLNGAFGKPVPGLGRWPANVLHDGSDEVVRGFPETTSGARNPSSRREADGDGWGMSATGNFEASEGSAARFFYSAKADQDDRLGSKHPTVKPVDLMQWLCRLVTPKNGTVLDCFAGTGTTGEAAWREGFNAVLIEREEEYCNDIRRRMALCMSGPDERARESIKARTKDKPVDHGPLFGAAMTAPPLEQSPLSREPLQ